MGITARLMCSIVGHSTYTVGIVCKHEPGHVTDVLRICVRCDYTEALIPITY